MNMPYLPLTETQCRALAEQFLKRGEDKQAAHLYSSFLSKHAKNAGIALQLARLYRRHKQDKQACATLERAASYGASDFEFFYMLSALQLTFSKFKQAEKNIKKAIALEDSSAPAYNLLGLVSVELSNHDDALSAFLNSIRISPDSADAHNNIAWLYRSIGNTEGAIEHFNLAIKYNPLATEALNGLILLKHYHRKEPEILAAEELLKHQSLNKKQKSDLEFSLGKAYEDLKQYDEAFKYFQIANQTWKQSFSYTTGDSDSLFSSIKTTFSHEYMKKKSTIVASNNIRPIFVLGMPRASTTLVEQILASHSKISGGGELSYLKKICFDDTAALNWPHDLSDAKLQRMSDRYLENLAKYKGQGSIVTDKMPLNFLLIGAIAKLFPNARIIHCKRSPLDICLSLYKHHFPKSDHHYAYDLQELGHFYGLYDDLMKHWHTTLPGKIYDIQYEALVDNFEPEIKGLLEYCDLEFEQICLQFHNTKRVIRTASSEQVRRGLYSSSVGRWKKYERHLDDLKVSLRSYS